MKFEIQSMNYGDQFQIKGNLTEYKVMPSGDSRGFAIVRGLRTTQHGTIPFSITMKNQLAQQGWGSKEEAQAIADFLNSTIKQV